MSDYILVIDTGCILLKVVLYDFNGVEVAVAQSELPFTFTHPDRYTRNLDQVWEIIISLINELFNAYCISPNMIKCITSVSYGNGLILLDKSGRPTCDAISSSDNRALSIVDEYANSGVDKNLRPYTLQSLLPGQSAALLKWFSINEPGVLEESSYFISCKDYSNYRLTGSLVSDKSTLSATSLYSVIERKYDDRIFELLNLSRYSHILPEDLESTEICGYVTASAAKETGLIQGTPVITGLIDTVSSSLATGLVNTNKKENLIVNVIAGTWTIDQYLTTTPQIDDNVFATRIHPSKNHWAVSENGSTSTCNLDWYIENFLPAEVRRAKETGHSIFEFCDQALHSIRPECSDIIFLPFIYGSNIGSEVKSGNELTAVFFNLKKSDTQEHIIRAIYEGITFSHIYQIKRLFTSIPQTLLIRLAGGGSASKEWAQIFADAIQAPVETTNCTNTNALGAAICASVGINKYSTLEEAVENMVYINSRILPNHKNKDIYEEKYYRYTSLILKLTGTSGNFY